MKFKNWATDSTNSYIGPISTQIPTNYGMLTEWITIICV